MIDSQPLSLFIADRELVLYHLSTPVDRVWAPAEFHDFRLKPLLPFSPGPARLSGESWESCFHILRRISCLLDYQTHSWDISPRLTSPRAALRGCVRIRDRTYVSQRSRPRNSDISRLIPYMNNLTLFIVFPGVWGPNVSFPIIGTNGVSPGRDSGTLQPLGRLPFIEAYGLSRSRLIDVP